MQHVQEMAEYGEEEMMDIDDYGEDFDDERSDSELEMMQQEVIGRFGAGGPGGRAAAGQRNRDIISAPRQEARDGFHPGMQRDLLWDIGAQDGLSAANRRQE